MTETTSESISAFCWSVIFELRQPMTAIKGHAQRAQLLLQTDPHRACEALDEVVGQIARIDQLLLELQERERGASVTPELNALKGRRPAREGART